MYSFGMVCMWLLFSAKMESGEAISANDPPGISRSGPLIAFHPDPKKDFNDFELLEDLKQYDLMSSLGRNLVQM